MGRGGTGRERVRWDVALGSLFLVRHLDVELLRVGSGPARDAVLHWEADLGDAVRELRVELTRLGVDEEKGATLGVSELRRRGSDPSASG
jgi:hypothetical protein